MCCIVLVSEHVRDAGHNCNWTLLFCARCAKRALNIGVWMLNGSVWRRMGAYGCVTDAYEYIRMHVDAYGHILGTRYWVLGAR